MKKILVACGSGIATSTVARNAIEEKLEERGVDMSQLSFDQTSIPQIPSIADQYDLIITTAKYTEDVNKPILNGLPFLTNIGEDKVIDQILDTLNLK
ncbi:PTS sugar transporter subunit IIB [Xylocopilactobacillus apicola]|uniref:PTS galactitol transporter subunit IIB n=1 Tax=Xylocopilactobacillus apicola TaxID=2932184 RepID=A0AAU9D6W8_9LACO|nr:PTS sugar transporter subunit IIB [Xylocopilactobacillus apicola]BDR59293.1 PTS galactitol transporter subunit IIB [Xylocopilactobacillus apicola]